MTAPVVHVIWLISWSLPLPCILEPIFSPMSNFPAGCASDVIEKFIHKYINPSPRREARHVCIIHRFCPDQSSPLELPNLGTALALLTLLHPWLGRSYQPLYHQMSNLSLAVASWRSKVAYQGDLSTLLHPHVYPANAQSTGNG